MLFVLYEKTVHFIYIFFFYSSSPANVIHYKQKATYTHFNFEQERTKSIYGKYAVAYI